MSKLLTKNEILEGIKKVETVCIEALQGEVKIRPLSAVEWGEIEEIEAKALGSFETQEKAMRGQRKKSSVESKARINIEQQTKASNEAKYKAVSLALSVDGEEWTIEEVQCMPIAALKEIFENVQRISGVDLEEDDVEQFPKDK